MNNFGEYFSYALNQLRTVTFIDIIDMALVACIIYFIIRFISDKRASKLALGVCMIISLLLVSIILGMTAINFLFSNIMQAGLILLVVLFQPEIRSALEKIGSAGRDLKILPSSKDHKFNGGKSKGGSAAIDIICEAVNELSKDYTGALIVIERTTPLGEIAHTGTVVNADPSVALIKNIFYNKAPLHDGAMLIRNFRIHSAGCFLPLSTKSDIVKDLGTRHRAAVGMSENSDAVVIVVSEETGTVSVAIDGKLKRHYDSRHLKKTLKDMLCRQSDRLQGDADDMGDTAENENINSI